MADVKVFLSALIGEIESGHQSQSKDEWVQEGRECLGFLRAHRTVAPGHKGGRAIILDEVVNARPHVEAVLRSLDRNDSDGAVTHAREALKALGGGS